MSHLEDRRSVVPGEVLVGEGALLLYAGQPITTLRVINTGDRPVQVGSHYHFAEANSALEFDRAAAHGQHLAVAAGTSVRFEPGAALEVELVPVSGLRVIAGLRGLVAGSLEGNDPIDEGAFPSPKARDNA